MAHKQTTVAAAGDAIHDLESATRESRPISIIELPDGSALIDVGDQSLGLSSAELFVVRRLLARTEKRAVA